MSCACAEHVCSLSLAWSFLKEQRIPPRQNLYNYRFSETEVRVMTWRNTVRPS